MGPSGLLLVDPPTVQTEDSECLLEILQTLLLILQRDPSVSSMSVTKQKHPCVVRGTKFPHSGSVDVKLVCLP